jgi:polyvinyl alcohol dehydrogenase (cytochrome)
MRMNGFTSQKNDRHKATNVARARGCVLAFVLATVAASPLMAQDWPAFGYDLSNTADGLLTEISAKNVNQLKPKWTFTTGGDVSARAAVVGGIAYFPDWAGNIWAVNATNGKLIWSHQLSDYGLTPGTVSRTSPTVVLGVVYIGTQYNATAPTGQTGWLLAINASTGKLNWKTQPDTSNAFPVITASPTVAWPFVYVGMTSNEEFAAADPSYRCCSARGSVVALNAITGGKLWQTFTTPTGYSGANIWGSSPVVDIIRGAVFVGTGNNYSIPTDPTYTSCIANGGTEATCLSPNDLADSIIALDMLTGHVKWAKRLMSWNQAAFGITNGSDFWNVDCVNAASGTANCPPPPTGPDYDFGSGPNEITYLPAKGPRQTIIGAGQKSGIYYALNPDTGALLWQTQVGPGSSLGGMEWGSTSDGQRIYVAISDFYGVPYTAGSAGSWAALDPATGAILWQTADPNGAADLGPLAVANGVVYAPSMGGPVGGSSSTSAPTMFGLNASTGSILWSFDAGSSVIAGAAIADNGVYWGSGYAHLGIPGFTGGTKFYGFTLNGN